MNLSVKWLSDLLGMTIDPDDATERLGMLGAPVEEMRQLHSELGDVVVGLVEDVRPHPDADRLTLCKVNDGARVLEVVCGAPNVQAGKKYAYAPVGAVLPGGLELSAKKIRGVVSNGMLLSAKEMGLGADRSGILELNTDAAPGTALLDALPVADTRLTIEVTANRPDLLCHKGVARELGAVYGKPIKLPKFPGAAKEPAAARRVTKSGASDGVHVVIEDAAGCPRYMAAVIRDVQVGLSPAWLEARLRSIGARPINNVVDATNYVLYELNQPLHAFDLAKLAGPKIVVRRATNGEGLTTLDGERRELTTEMTMICDARGPTAIAGVMGGEHSEVGPDTADIVLECAYFDPVRIRGTRRALGMSTEASYRFERGIDLQALPDALRRAVQLIQTVAGGDVRAAPVDVYPRPAKPRAVFLRPERVEHLLGKPVSAGRIERLLVSIGFAVAPKGKRLHVQVPGWRPDVTREVDLIEEIARLEGYDAFPVELRPLRPSVVPNDPVEALKTAVRRVFTTLGLHEARSLPLVPDGGERAVPLLNPLSAEEGFLRQSLVPGLVRSVERNWAARERDVRLFEVGQVFEQADDGAPAGRLRLAAVVTGARTPPHWTAGGKAPEYDVWDIKHMFEEAARTAGPVGHVVARDDGWVFEDEDGRCRGRAGPLSTDRPAWAGPVYGMELDVEVRERPYARFEPLPSTPPVERDLALVLPADVSAADVEAVMRDAGGALLERVAVFDEYRGAEVDGRSVAWHLVFRAPDRTLRDAEVDESVSRILGRLGERFDVQRRT